MIGDIYAKTPVSAFQPSKEVADFTSFVQRDFQSGYDILNKPYTELNDMSVIERDNRDKRTFNAFVDESIEDPNTAWEWRGTRSKARNKAIAMHAQLTAGYIIPMFLAQNDDDEEDKGFSDMMRDGCEWLVDNSDYKSSFLQASMGMLVNTVTYMGAEYCEVYQTIKEKTAKGYSKKEILDEVLSGFKAPVYSSDQILISNAYEQNIQRHRFNIPTRWIEYSEAESKYGDHENWEHVKAGVNTIFNGVDGQFYDVKDDSHPFMVQEVTYKNRTDDTEACFLGGIYMGDTDPDMNPIKHRDNRGAPKYNVVPFGYQRISEHFYFYKSLMNAQYWDNQLLDAQYEIGMNRAFLDANMPLAVSGTDKVDSDIIFPKAIAVFQDKETKVTPMLPQANLGNMFSGMATVEKSMDESAGGEVSNGQLPEASQKATTISIAQQNARTLMQGVGKTLAQSMVQMGDLMKDVFLNHFTIPQVIEIAGGDSKLKYRTLILNNKNVGGKDMTKVLKFDDSLLGEEMSNDQKMNEELDMLSETGYPDDDKVIMRINPEMCARFRYLTRVEPEKMFPKNEEFQQALNMQLLQQLQQNPFVSLEALTRETLYSFYRGRADKFMQKPVQSQGMGQPQQGGVQAGQMAMGSALGKGMAGAGMV